MLKKIVPILNAVEDTEKINHSYIFHWNVKSNNHSRKQLGIKEQKQKTKILKLNMQLPYTLAVILLGIYPLEMKTLILKNPVRECLQQLYL